MKCRRILAGLLAAALAASLLILPAAAAPASVFTDISDPDTAEAAQILYMLGVVDGTGGGRFRPEGTLTRAEFCKMAVDVMGKGDLESAQRGRTIFLDVGSGHWARGYINLAASLTTNGELAGVDAASDGGETAAAADRLISGVGDGNFQPDRAISYGEAVAILVRILGYTTADISLGAQWYDGYLAVAQENGLLEGLNRAGNATITRGEAAKLFRNLLFTKGKAAQDCYLVAKLGGSLTEDTVLLSLDVNTSGGSNTVTVANGAETRSPKTDRTALAAELVGVRGEMVQDKEGKFLTLRPSEDDSIRRVTVNGTVDANYITAGGEKITIDPETTVWRNGEATTFEKVWTYLYNGTPVTLCYGPSGKLDYVFLSSASQSSEDVMVARTAPNGTTNPFAALTGGARDYRIYKNGVPATLADLRQYDVATYDSASKVLSVSDLRLTGYYENAQPTPTAPAQVTMLGQTFDVLPGAVSDLAAFAPGDTVTLLFTSDGRVAGALDPSVARSTTVGVVESGSGNRAKVRPLLDFFNAAGERVVFEGETNMSESNLAKLVGQLVTVSSGKDRIYLSRLTGGDQVSGSLNVSARTLDGVELAENARLFERVGNSQPKEITFDQLTRTTVPAGKILYAGKDYAGKYNILVFDDVTGDQYDYGFSLFTPRSTSDDPMFADNHKIAVKNGANPSGGTALISGVTFRSNEVIGIVASMDTMDGTPKLAGSVTNLQSASGVARGAYDPENHTLKVGEQVFPISQMVWCYNKTTGYWFEADTGYERFELARAYAPEMTVYYDKSPQQGGKIRMVVVE